MNWPAGGRDDRLARGHDERGVVVVIMAMSLVAMLAAAALVVDAGRLFVDRRTNQAVADFAGRAALPSLPGNPLSGCTAAWAYIQANLRGLPPGPTSPCTSSFPTSCTSNTPAADYPAGSTGLYTVTFHYPVADSEISPLQGNDGAQCERMRITVSITRPSLLASALGILNEKVTSTAIARRAPSGSSGGIADLVVLDPTGCETLLATGGGTIQAGTPSSPGIISADSDGSGCSGTGGWTTDASGGSHILGFPTSGGTTGYIRLFAMAPGQTACATSGAGQYACSATQVTNSAVAPQPTPLPARITRAFVDDRYNCKASYPPYHLLTLPACTAGTNPYVDNLVAALGPTGTNPAGYTPVITNCTTPPSGTTTFPAGNWWINCPGGLNIGSGTTFDFQGGNVLVDGNINLSAGGAFIVNDANPATSLPVGCGSSVCVSASSQNAAFVYMRSGSPNRSGGSFNLYNTSLFIAAATVNLTGNFNGTPAPTIKLLAPTEGPFTNLAVWDETPGPYSISGGAQLNVGGVFFTPEAIPFTITGATGSQQYDGQFVSYHFSASGQGTLTLNPNPNRLITTGGATTTGFYLIR